MPPLLRSAAGGSRYRVQDPVADAIGDKVPRRTLDSLVTQVASELKAVEYATEPTIVRPGRPTYSDYQETINRASGIDEVTSAAVPLLSRGEPIGLLGFVKHGDREWSTRELNVLKAIASLFAQLQAR